MHLSDPGAPRARRRGRSRAATAALGLTLALGTTAYASAAPTADPDPGAGPGAGDASARTLTRDDLAQYEAGRYIVMLQAAPAALNAGLRASGDEQLDAADAKVAAYTGKLRGAHDRLAKSLGFSIKRHYTLSANGFVADLSAKQATELATDRDVLVVQKDSRVYADSVDTTAYLGLTGRRGVWSQVGGQAKAGDGVVVGVIDSGIWPESRSFRGKALTTKPQGRWGVRTDGADITMRKADGGVFRGRCETGEQFAATDCNSKLITARSFVTGFGSGKVLEEDFLSPRDGNGHGSHTASTAAGEPVTDVTTEGIDFGTISGVAPGAKIASYKALWATPDGRASGSTSDLVAAIEQSVKDGVDVLNYSISGNTDTNLDAAEIAFEGAAEAGVFVAASAGNSGPGASTVAHNSPWVTTVAANTYTRLENTVVLGDGQKLAGASVATKPLPSTPLVDAAAVGNGSASSTDTALCKPDSLDPAKVAGKAVVCQRGVYDRTAKSAEVKRAGGVAVVMVNPTENSLDADFHAIPTVHLSDKDGAKVAAYLQKAGAAATVSFAIGNTTGTATPVPQIAGFSSRGPANSDDGDLLKPDVSAPGVSVLAAVAPPSNAGRDYDLYSGTSMSAPHVAGLAALVQGKHPRWSPMQIKSAMMTSAYDLRDASGKASKDLFAEGAGHVNPAGMLDPGLVVTSGADQWRGYMAHLGLDTGAAPLAPNAINLPSIAEGDVVDTATFTRTFTAVRRGQWSIKVDVPGFSVRTSVPRVDARRLGQEIPVTFTFKRTGAALDRWAMGHITLTGPTTVRLPVALKPVAVSAPGSVTGTGVSGSTKVSLTAGLTGDLALSPLGLAKAQQVDGQLAAGDFTVECVTVGAGNKVAQFDLVAADPTSDLDMYVYSAESCDPSSVGDLVAEVATSSAGETFSLENAPAGSYLVEVSAFAAGTKGNPVGFSLRGYDLGGSPSVGGFAVTPQTLAVRSGEQTSYTASWSGLEPGAHYLGRVSYAGSPDPTYVYVDTAP